MNTIRKITTERLLELLRKEETLYALECAGVDVWGGYVDAMEARDEGDVELLLEGFPEDTYQ